MKGLLAVLLTALTLPKIWAADVVGTVSNDQGQPVPGATVEISTAQLRSGSSLNCPACWFDCGRRATTDGQGRFHIPRANDKLVFRLIVVAPGYAPARLEKVDPRAGPVQARLKIRDLASFHGAQVIRGQVTDAAGHPIAGASVEPGAMQPEIDPLTFSDPAGRFVLTSSQDIRGTTLLVQAPGFAPARVGPVAGGDAALTVKLGVGVVLSGRVVDGAKPLADVKMGLVQIDRTADQFLGVEVVTTDAAGRFHFAHAPSHTALSLFGTMDSLGHRGAVSAREVDAGDDGSSLDAGTLVVQPALTLTGRLQEATPARFPAGTRIRLSRDSAWDDEDVDVAGDGSFTFSGIPKGEQIEVIMPVDHQIESADGGFTIDKLNRRATGTLVESGTLNIGVIAQPQREIWNNVLSDFVAHRYADFFQQESFSPEQVKLFLAAKAEERHVTADARRGGATPSAAQAQAADVLESRLTSAFGAPVYQDYLAFDGRDLGEAEISNIYHPGVDHWLSEADRPKLAGALGAVLFRDMERCADPSALSKAEQDAWLERSYAQMEAAGKKVLPPESQAAFVQALEKWRQLSAATDAPAAAAPIN